MPKMKHGLKALQGRVRARGIEDAVDRRSSGYRSMAAFRDSLIEDLGGDLSTQQAALVDLASRCWLYLGQVDSWLMSQDSILQGRGKQKTLLPVLRERNQLASNFESLMSRLGLEKQRAEPVSLSSYVKSRYGSEKTPSNVSEDMEMDNTCRHDRHLNGNKKNAARDAFRLRASSIKQVERRSRSL